MDFLGAGAKKARVQLRTITTLKWCVQLQHKQGSVQIWPKKLEQIGSLCTNTTILCNKTRYVVHSISWSRLA